MTDQETQQTKDTALARCIRMKRAVNIANEAINQAAETLENTARILRSPQKKDFVFNSHPWLNYEPLYRLIREADKTQQDFTEANAIAASLGEAII